MHLWKHPLRGRALVTAITAASCQAFLLLGYDQGVMSGIIGANNRFAADFDNPDAAMQGNITSLYDIGCVLGSILVYFIGDRFGRRTMLMAGGAIMIVGAAILAASDTIAQLIVGRIITGFGNGMNSSTAPVYQSECSPAHIRGALLTLQGTVTILGVVIGTWLASFPWRPLLSSELTARLFLSICQPTGPTLAPLPTRLPFNTASRSPSRPFLPSS